MGIDIGSAFTKAALFEPVEGQYRLIARGQARTDPTSHIYETLVQACTDIETHTGRLIFKAGEPLAGEVSHGRGVEVLGVSIGPVAALRVLTTNSAAAAVAREEGCVAEVLPRSRISEHLVPLTDRPWDAIAGQPNEVAEARMYLGYAEGDSPAGGPAGIQGDSEAIRRGLAQLNTDRVLRRLPGMAELAAAATEPLTIGTRALAELTQLIASRFGLRLAIVDCGSTKTTVCQATPTETRVRVAWHKQPIADVPVSAKHITDLHSELQEALQSCSEPGFSADLVVATGALVRFDHWSEPALTLLNGLRPLGVTQLALDSGGIVTQIATFASSYPDVACQIFEQDGLLALGTAICPGGSVEPGAKALDIRWQTDDDAEQTAEVKFGELVRLPLPSGRKANLSLYPAKQLDVGLNQPGVAATAHVDGGRIGLIVDVRDPANKSGRAPWQQALE